MPIKRFWGITPRRRVGRAGIFRNASNFRDPRTPFRKRGPKTRIADAEISRRRRRKFRLNHTTCRRLVRVS